MYLLFQTINLTIARLLVKVRLVTHSAPAPSIQDRPLAVALAQVRGDLHLLGVVHALAGGLLDDRHLAARRRRREAREVDGCLRAGDVVHLERERVALGDRESRHKNLHGRAGRLNPTLLAVCAGNGRPRRL